MQPNASEKILIVDDQAAVRKIFRKTLERESYLCVEAETVREARSLLGAGGVTLAIVDLILPDGSGLDLIRYIRQELPETEAIVLTGSADFSAVVEGVRLGACGYLLKPLVPSQIIECVKEALEQRREQVDLRLIKNAAPLALVVDADPIQIRTMNNWLTRLGFATALAADFDEALRVMSESSPDIVISDAVLQGGRGLDLVTEARGRLPRAPFILCAGSTSVETAVTALRRGVYDFLTKPVEKEAFEAAVRRAQVLVQMQKDRERLERSNEMFRKRLTKLSGDLDRRVKESVTEITSLQRFPTMILNSLPTGTVTTDRNLRITSTNPAAQRFLGVSGPMLEGREIEQLPQLRPFVAQLREAVEKRIRINRQQAQVEDLELGSITLGYGCCPLLDPESGHSEGGLLFFTDLTGNRRMESLQGGADGGIDVESVASSIAHEVNNPLTAAIGLIELLKFETELPQDVTEKIYKISVALERVTNVLKEKVEKSEVGRQTKTIDLHDAVLRVLELMELQLLESGISTATNFDARDPQLESWGREIEQVLANLIKNARDAMPEGGKLTLSTRDTAKGVLIEIKDSGTGMDPADIPRLLLPYQTTKPVGQGTGLGLPICHAIVARHRGTMELVSGVGKGCIVRLHFPRNQPEEIHVVKPSGQMFEIPATCRVAILDDEQPILDYCREALSRYGIQVQTFRSPKDFLARNQTEPYDVLISDVRMPEMSGFDVQDELLRLKAPTAVTLMTGSLSNLPRDRGIPHTQLRVLKKPFRETELIEAVHDALSEDEKPGPDSPPTVAEA